MRVEEERCKLATRIDEMVTEQLHVCCLLINTRFRVLSCSDLHTGKSAVYIPQGTAHSTFTGTTVQ
jgi:hypothetical protein